MTTALVEPAAPVTVEPPLVVVVGTSVVTVVIPEPPLVVITTATVVWVPHAPVWLTASCCSVA